MAITVQEEEEEEVEVLKINKNKIICGNTKLWHGLILSTFDKFLILREMLSVMVLFNSLKNSGYRLLLYAMTKQESSLIGKKSIHNASFEKTKVAPKPIRFWIDGKCFNIYPMKKRTKGYDKTGGNF